MNDDAKKTKPNATETPDPFDLDSLRIDPDAGGLSAVQRVITHVPVRKPDKQQFVRVHPETELPVALLILKDEGETYVVAPSLQSSLVGETTMATLHLAVTPQQVLFIWPVTVPGDPPNAWHSSAVEAAIQARDRWTKVVADRYLRAYCTFVAVGQLPDPVWPDELGDTPAAMMQAAIRIGFRDRLIGDLDHPVLKRLRGEAL